MSKVILKSNISTFLLDLDKVVTSEILKASTELLVESRNETPIDTGLLRNTGSIKMKKSPDKLEVMIGYSTDYAIEVHENYNVRHIIGNAGYLIGPYRRKEAIIIKDLSAKISKLCKGR